MSKIDFKKTFDGYKAKSGVFRILEIPRLQYLMIDGDGAPGFEMFNQSLQALYPMAYKLKFASKELSRDYVVPPLEGLWWADDMTLFTTARDKSKWRWTLLLMVPNWITQDMFQAALKKISEKNKPNLLSRVRLEALDEGLCVQTLHIGSFDNEGPVLETMHDQFIPENNLTMTHKHHEIYLSDFRKVAPEKLKTILRQPVIRQP